MQLTSEELGKIGIFPNNRNVSPVYRQGWDKYFLDLAYKVSERSIDANTHHGCVLVRDKIPLIMGYNGFPPNSPDSIMPNTRNGGFKYLLINHSEENCIYLAARSGINIDGATAYISGRPCQMCAKRLVSCNITNWYIGNISHTESEVDNILFRFWVEKFGVNINQWCDRDNRFKRIYVNGLSFSE